MFLEGGAQLYSLALKAKVVTKCSFFIAPTLFGQPDAMSVVHLDKFSSLSDALSLTDVDIMSFGDNVCMSGYPIYK